MYCTIMSDSSILTACIVSRPYIMSVSSWLTVLYLHHALCRRIWYYCIYTVHCSVIPDIIVFTAWIVPSYLILLYLHRELFRHIWYYCIYTVNCSVISDITVFTPCIVPSYLTLLLHLRHLVSQLTLLHLRHPMSLRVVVKWWTVTRGVPGVTHAILMIPPTLMIYVKCQQLRCSRDYW
jgi:hypothetical protein